MVWNKMKSHHLPVSFFERNSRQFYSLSEIDSQFIFIINSNWTPSALLVFVFQPTLCQIFGISNLVCETKIKLIKNSELCLNRIEKWWNSFIQKKNFS